MLDFCKKILTNVSFDRFLFRKELKKAVRLIKGDERIQLKEWCLANYGNIYEDIIMATFQPKMSV